MKRGGVRLERLELKRGNVVVVPSELGRPRPGVIVPADEFNTDLTTVFICPISSDVQERLPLRPVIEAGPSNGLQLRSQFMTEKMIALRRDRVRQVIGHIDSETPKARSRAARRAWPDAIVTPTDLPSPCRSATIPRLKS